MCKIVYLPGMCNHKIKPYEVYDQNVCPLVAGQCTAIYLEYQFS